MPDVLFLVYFVLLLTFQDRNYIKSSLKVITEATWPSKLLHELGGWGMMKFTLLWEILEFLCPALLLLLFACCFFFFLCWPITLTPFPDSIGKRPKIGVLGTFLSGLSRPSWGEGSFSTTAVREHSRRCCHSIWQSLDLAVSTRVRNKWTNMFVTFHN